MTFPRGRELMTVKNIASDAEFNELLSSSGRPVVVDFSASWCGPCRKMEPFFRRIASEMGDKATFVTLDIERCPHTAAEYEIMSVPAIVVLQHGVVAGRVTGALPEEKLKERLKSILEECG